MYLLTLNGTIIIGNKVVYSGKYKINRNFHVNFF